MYIFLSTENIFLQHFTMENGPFEDVFCIENGDIPAS